VVQVIKITSKIRLAIDNEPKLAKAVQALTSKEVLVGIPSEAAPRRGSKINNATLGYIHDTGSPAANIPARPFLGPGILQAKDRILSRLKKMGESAIKGVPTSVEDGLNAIGLIAVNSVRAKIQSGPFAPLAKSTIRARLRRGRTGVRPLIDTGQLRNSITYVLRDK
jgi:phage gpG-like protein